jgi:hypothetical protein
MLLPVLAALTLGAAPQVKLAAPGLAHVGVDDSVAAMFSQHFAQQLELNGVHVVAQQEIAALIGLERQKQLLGCSDGSTNCVAEIGGALGVDGVITGTIAKLDNGYLVNLKIASSLDGSSMASVSRRGKSDGELVDWMTEIAPEIAAQLKAAKSGAPVGAVSASGGLRSKSWVPAVVGAAFLITGVALIINAYMVDHQIRSGDPQILNDPNAPTRLNAAVSQGDLSQTLGWTAVAIAGACGATALGFYLFGADAPQVSAVLTPEGGFATVKVRWP